VRTLVVCLLLAAVDGITTLSAQDGPSTLLPSAAEFPPDDWQIFGLQRQGALTKLAAARLATDPASADTFELLVKVDRLAAALQVLERIVDERPEHLPRALELLFESGPRFSNDDPHGYGDALRGLAARARTRLTDLPREDAARTARALIPLEGRYARAPSSHRDALRALATEYQETQAATMADIELTVDTMLESRSGRGPLRTDVLDELIRKHEGTVVGARALFEKGFHLAHNSGERPGTDPTNRLMQVLDIVHALESGRYPRCEWTEKAPSLITGFFSFQPKFAPGNASVVVDAYLHFVRTHFTIDERMPGHNGIGYIITNKIPELLARTGEGEAGVERVLTRLEGDSAIGDQVRYLRARFYIRGMNDDPDGPGRPTLYRKARETLSALHDRSTGALRRRALATLASLEFKERDFARARDDFAAYLRAYPQADWSWVGALRLGQAEASLGNWKDATDAYQSAARRYASTPVAVVLAHAYAGRAYEALGRFDEALSSYRRALAAWDNDYGQTYSLYDTRVDLKNQPLGLFRDEAKVERHALAWRRDRLAASLALSGGAELERGRWLVLNGQLDAGLAALNRVSAEHAGSPIADEARELARRARLDHALDLAAEEALKADEPAAVNELELLSRDGTGFSASAAKIARAAILWKRGARTEAESLGLEGVKALYAHQLASMQQNPLPTGLEADIVEIRNLVFRPAGDGLFTGTQWSGFARTRSKPFLVMRQRMTVELATGELLEVPAFRLLPEYGNVLLLTVDQLAFFERLITRIGGTKRREPAHIMEVPNQPIGASVDVLAFLNTLFPAIPGHWGGWMFETFPTITRIEFVNAERTKVAVHVTIEYEGATLVLEKQAGRWVWKATVDRWMT
jgi:tetratricopeptide (TPR) repeat protein